MARQSIHKSAFNAGELSPLFEGRIDHVKYPQGLSKSRNGIPSVHGSLVRRPGTVLVDSVGETSGVFGARQKAVALVPHVISGDEAYVYAFGEPDAAVVVYKDRGDFGGFTNPLNARARRSDGTSKLSSVPVGRKLWLCDDGESPLVEIRREVDFVEAGGAFPDTPEVDGTLSYEHPTPYHANYQTPPFQDYDPATSPLIEVKGTVEHNGFGVNAFIRAPTGTFPGAAIGMRLVVNPTFDEIKAKMGANFRTWEKGLNVQSGQIVYHDGRFYEVNSTTADVLALNTEPLHESGAIFSKAVPPYNWQLGYIGNGHFSCTIAANPQEDGIGFEKVLVRWDFAQAPPCQTSRWAWAAIATSPNIEPGASYPDNIAFFRNRLVLSAGGRLYFSQPGEYRNFNQYDPSGEILPECAIVIEIPSRQLVAVDWLIGMDQLMVGSKVGVFACAEDSSQLPFGPGNVRIDNVSTCGTHRVEPVQIDGDIFYVLRGGKRLHRLTRDGGAWRSVDVSVIADHLALDSITELAWQDEPWKTVWMATGSGRLQGMVWNLQQDVWGWHPHDSSGDLVVGMTSIPAPSGEIDDIWISALRRTNGQPGETSAATIWRNQVEHLADPHRPGDDVRKATYCDSAIRYDGLRAAGSPVNILAISTAAGGDGTWTETDLIQVTRLALFTTPPATFYATDVGSVLRLLSTNGLVISPEIDYDGPFADLEIVEYIDSATVRCKPLAPVSVENQSGAYFWEMRINRLFTGGALIEGREVDILADGATHPRATVVGSGSGQYIPLVSWFCDIVAGIPCELVAIPMRIEGGGEFGTSQGKIKRIDHVTFRFLETYSARCGAREADADVVRLRDSSMAMDRPIRPYTGDAKIQFNGGNTTDGYIVVKCDQPVPFTMISMVIDVDMGG